MGLGFSKVFTIVLLFACAWAYYLRDWRAIFPVLIPFVVIRVIWKALTQK